MENYVLQIVSEEDSVEILFKDLDLVARAYAAFVANALRKPNSGLKEIILIASTGQIIGQYKA